MVAKRKIAFHPEKGYPITPSTPPKTVRRNARERNRVKQIDQGFDKLKSNIPVAANQKKISRVKILSSAVEYIQQLHTILNEHEAVCRQGGVKVEAPRPLTPPKALMGQLGGAYQGGYMHYPQHPSPMNTHSPISPYGSFDSSSMSSGYYSNHSPGLRSNPPYREYYSPRGAVQHSPSSSYSEPSPLSHQVYPHGIHPSPHTALAGPLPTPLPAVPPLTQDPTPSSTFQEEDEDILNSIIQWEKY